MTGDPLVVGHRHEAPVRFPRIVQDVEDQRGFGIEPGAFDLTDADIALLCASHNGEPRHTERVASLLARIGASESVLACGTHEPYFFRALGQTPPPGAQYNRLQHNCSGKHTGMLMLAHVLGQPLAGYLDVAHPVQSAIAQSVAHFSGIAPDRLVRGARVNPESHPQN